MKYIEANKVKAEIDKIIDALKSKCNNESLDKIQESIAVIEIIALNSVKDIIDKMKQDEPTPPGIEEESHKKGWLDYRLMVDEIGLHRYNAIHRIKEHKEHFDPRTIPNLYHIATYYESVGMEKVCCCLLQYCQDFLFTQDEVKKIIKEENSKFV